MKRFRVVEFLLVVVVVAVAVVMGFLRRSTPTPSQTPSPAPTVHVTHTTQMPFSDEIAMEHPDFSDAEGLTGYEEVRAMKVPPPLPASLQRGEALYKKNCAVCHGSTLGGDGEAGRALDPSPTNLRNTYNYKYGFREHHLYRSIFYGVDGTGMVPFEGLLTPEEVWDVVHFVRSRQRKLEASSPPQP